jgi:hypothetical protein
MLAWKHNANRETLCFNIKELEFMEYIRIPPKIKHLWNEIGTFFPFRFMLVHPVQKPCALHG